MTKEIFLLLLLILIIIRLYILNNKNVLNENFENENEHDKIAFCFLTIGDIHQINLWKKFLKGNEDKYNIYIHPKEIEKVNNEWKKYIIKDRVETKWGDISLVKASLKLFQEAYKNDANKMFILVSDSCIPIYNFNHIYNNLINHQITRYSIRNKDQDNMLKPRYNKILNNTNNEFLEYSKFKKQSQWCIINRNDIQIMIEKNNDYTDLYKNVFAPDEHYFINISEKLNLKYDDTKTVTFDNWNAAELDVNSKYNKLPKTYLTVSMNDIKKAKNEGALFFRKVVPETKIDTNDNILFTESV